MSNYQALDLKYRPKHLNEVLGQAVAVGKIKGFLKSGKIPRTIMLHGAFGSGKTSLARIIASYLNCQKHAMKANCYEAKEEKPCRTCEYMFRSPPNHPDYCELNAANSRGIDDVRNLIELSNLMPSSNYRVFALEEAQQFTGAAAQALLKPLEEPSPKSIWMILTTNPEKILPTIQSRCFQISIQKLEPVDMVDRLIEISKLESDVELTPDLALKIAEAAHGHPRSAIKGLESVLAYINARGSDDVEASLSEILKDVIKVQPETILEKYVRQLSTFRLLKATSHEFVMGLLQTLLSAGWIDLTPSEHPVPYVTKSGWSVMRGEAPARVRLPREVAASSRQSASGQAGGQKGTDPHAKTRSDRPTKAKGVDVSTGDLLVFEALRQVRADLARDRKVPAYIIAANSTLQEMARKRPRDEDELLGIRGMGPFKVESYGEALLEAIEEVLTRTHVKR